MENNEFSISYKVVTPDFTKRTVQKFDSKFTLGNVKTIAEQDFEIDFVKSVCVVDNKGTARLYLKKTAEGIIREEKN